MPCARLMQLDNFFGGRRISPDTLLDVCFCDPRAAPIQAMDCPSLSVWRFGQTRKARCPPLPKSICVATAAAEHKASSRTSTVLVAAFVHNVIGSQTS